MGSVGERLELCSVNFLCGSLTALQKKKSKIIVLVSCCCVFPSVPLPPTSHNPPPPPPTPPHPTLLTAGDCVVTTFPFSRRDGNVSEVLFFDAPEPRLLTVQMCRRASGCVRLQGSTIKVVVVGGGGG